MDGLNTSSNDSSKFSSGRFSLPSIIVVVVEIVPVEISSTISVLNSSLNLSNYIFIWTINSTFNEFSSEWFDAELMLI